MAFYVHHPKRQVVNKILLSPQQDSPSAPVMVLKVFTQPLHPNLNHGYIHIQYNKYAQVFPFIACKKIKAEVKSHKQNVSFFKS